MGPGGGRRSPHPLEGIVWLEDGRYATAFLDLITFIEAHDGG